MTSPFEQLENALNLEGVRSNPALASLLPLQEFCFNETTLMAAFVKYFKSMGSRCNRVVFFTDGVPKSVQGRNFTVNALLQHECSEAGIPQEWINVPELLGVPSAEFHASVEHVPFLTTYLKNCRNSLCVVVGSGSLTDVVKHALFVDDFTMPFVVLPTALTVTAFTSSFAVLEESGAKRTRVSRPIDACFWFAPVLQAAPAAMSRAGYGDLLARFIAYADWYLSAQLGIATRYDELAYRLMEPFADALKRAAPGFSPSQPLLPLESVEGTAAALSMAGIAMSVSGETTPLSGYEHVISHGLDFLRLTSHRPLVLHGEQVALGSLSSAISLDFLLQIEEFDLKRLRTAPAEKAKLLLNQLLDSAPYWGLEMFGLNPDELRARHEKIAVGKAKALALFYEEYEKKHNKWLVAAQNFPDFAARWPEIKIQLRNLSIPASEMETLLVQSGLPLVPEAMDPSTTANEYRWAVRFSPFVRARMSIGDFIYWIGEDPAIVAIV